MIFDKELLDELTQQAKESPRLRFAYDLRTTPNDQSQRMLNAMEPGTIVPVHRHRETSEVVVALRGKVEWLTYDENGEIIDSFLLDSNGEHRGLIVPKSCWHSAKSLLSGSVIFEAKDGAWAPMEKLDILDFKHKPSIEPKKGPQENILWQNKD